MSTIFDLLNIPNPGDPEFAEYAFNHTQGIAKRLTEKGWKFIPRNGPHGHYYDGIGPRGKRIMSDQKTTKEEALLVALRHASDVDEPFFS